jgi:hypothetical protein
VSEKGAPLIVNLSFTERKEVGDEAPTLLAQSAVDASDRDSMSLGSGHSSLDPNAGMYAKNESKSNFRDDPDDESVSESELS